MGTQKQAHALVKMDNLIRKAQGIPPATTEQQAALAARVEAMSLPEIQALFKRANELLQFDRHTSPATVDQRRRIAQLEIANYGKARTTYRDALTFAAASDLLTELVADRAATVEGVREVERMANTSAPVGIASLRP